MPFSNITVDDLNVSSVAIYFHIFFIDIVSYSSVYFTYIAIFRLNSLLEFKSNQIKKFIYVIVLL